MSISTLNPSQREAVEYREGPLLVIAGAGSGKTRVITTKISELIATHGMQPQTIAAVTFTNKAAREMRSRIGDMLNQDISKGIQISTFHTLGLNIFRAEMATLGYRKGFSIYDDTDSMAILNELARGETEERLRLLRNQISRWKSACISHRQAMATAEDKFIARMAELYEAYDRHLHACNAIDFDDLLLIPVQLLNKDFDALNRWRAKIQYLLVDEYQDTNKSQYELVKLLVGDRGCLTVVGDDDQSIYAWRGAEPENMNLLAQDYPQLKVIKLEQNYRSMGGILQAANSVIANNPHVFEKALWSELGFGESLQVIRAANEEQEAEKVVTRLLHHKFRHRTEYRDYAILYRGNHQSRLFERALREYNIPYYLSGGTSFFAYTEIKDIMCYLRVITNPDDDNAMLRIINTPRREIGHGTLEKIVRFAADTNSSLFAAMHDPAIASALPGRAVSRVQDFVAWLDKQVYSAENDAPTLVVKHLIADIDYHQWLKDNFSDEKIAERKMDNVSELLEWIDRLSKKSSEAELADIVSRLTLLDILDRDDEQDGDHVHLMTLHAAKGLEFPHVYLVGMEEDLLPHRVSIEEDNIEEERRLAYVGITRAQKTLSFSYTLRRKRYGEMIQCTPSRFLDEIPQELLHFEGDKADPEKTQEEGRQTLSSLRALLNEK